MDENWWNFFTAVADVGVWVEAKINLFLDCRLDDN